MTEVMACSRDTATPQMDASKLEWSVVAPPYGRLLETAAAVVWLTMSIAFQSAKCL